MYGQRWLAAEGTPQVLFTENETNFKRLFDIENRAPYVKDAIDELRGTWPHRCGEPSANRDQGGAALPLRLGARREHHCSAALHGCTLRQRRAHGLPAAATLSLASLST